MLSACFTPKIKNYPSYAVDADEEKEFSIETNLGFSRGDESIIGSSYFDMGRSKIACYVFAPKPTTGKNISFERGCLECSVSFAAHLKRDESCVFDAENFVDGIDVLSNRLSSAVVDALKPAVRLESYPKCTINVSIVVIESSYQDLAACINATSLAICDAAVEMKDLVTAYPIYMKSSSGNKNNAMEVENSPTTTHTDLLLTLACMSNLQQITYLDSVGQQNPLYMMQLVESGQSQCEKLRTLLRNELIQHQLSLTKPATAAPV